MMQFENKMRIGPSGNSEEFYSSGHKVSEEIPKFLAERGLNAYEYSFGRGVNMSREKAEAIFLEAKKYDVLVSVHAPYYINLANPDDGMIQKSFSYILASAHNARLMGGKRVIFHPATEGKKRRNEAVSLMVENAKRLIDIISESGFSDMIFCPETMGKIKQIGDTREVLEICKLWNNFIPCLDFGHLNSRTLGGLKNAGAFEDEIKLVLDTLGDRGKYFHIHFSKIMYGASGEIKHLTFEDDHYGPKAEDMIEAIIKTGACPTIICESAGTQSVDALKIKEIIEKTV